MVKKSHQHNMHDFNSKQSTQKFLEILQMDSFALINYLSAEIYKNPFISFAVVESSGKESEVIYYNASSNTNNLNNLYTNSLYLHFNESSLLREHFKKQIDLAFYNARDKEMGYYLADSMDENGYLIETVDEIANALNMLPVEIEIIRQKLQIMNPVGCFSQDLIDCLTSQLEELNIYNGDYAILLANIDLILQNKMDKLVLIVQVSEEKIKEMLKVIKSLNPKPGLMIAKNNNTFRNPDIIIEEVNGKLIAKLNEVAFPFININKNLCRKAINNKADKDKYNTLLKEAYWLQEALKKRAEVILNIAKFILDYQRDFFMKESYYLKPIRLVRIAEQSNMPLNFINSVVDKIIVSAIGTFPFKHFFSTAMVEDSFDDKQSKFLIQNRIKELIKSRGQNNEISNEEINYLLQQEGILISKKKIAEYRQDLKLDSVKEG